MEDHDEKKVTRREAVKLAGIAAALGAGLGIAGEAEAGQDPGLFQHKDPAALQFKFYSVPDASGKQDLLLAIAAPAMLQKKVTMDGRFQIKLYQGSRGQAGQRPVQTVIAESIIQLKRDRGIRR